MNIRHAFTQMTAARLVVLVVSTATFMAVSRLLPPETFGVFLAIVVVTELVTAIADFGIGDSIARRSTLTEHELGAAIGLALALALPAGMAIALAAALLPDRVLSGEARAAVLLLALTLPVLAIANPLEAALQREIRFGLVSVLGIARVVAEAIVTVSLALAGFGVLALAAGRLAQHALPALILVAARLREGGLRPRRSGWRDFLVFGSAYSGIALIQKGGNAAASWSVNLLLGVATLGLLNRARRVVELLDRSVLDGVVPVILPAVSRSLDAGADPARVTLLKIDYLAGLCWPVFGGIVLMADPLVQVVLGPRWDDVVPAVQVLALAGFLQPVTKMSQKMFVALDILPDYMRIVAVQQGARVVLMGAGALVSFEAACLGAVLATALKAAMISRRLKRRTGYRGRALLAVLRRAAALTALTLAAPALLVVVGPDWPALPHLLAGIALAAAGWFGGMAILRHPLLAEVLQALGADRAAARLGLS